MNQSPFPVHLIEGNRWIIADSSTKMAASIVEQEKKEANIEGTHLIGWLYIDSMAGLSLQIRTLAVVEPDGTIKPTGGALARKIAINLRYDDETFQRFKLLTNEEIAYLNLPAEPPHMDVYRRSELEPLRKLPYLHHLRAPGYPDDIQVILIPATDDMRPEQVWAKLKRQVEQYTFECELLNDPYQKLGIKSGDSVIARLAQVDNGILAVSEGQRKFR